MPASQPRIFINHAAQKLAVIGIRAFPQNLKRPRRRNDGIIVNALCRRNLAQFIRQPCTAGNAVDKPFGTFQNFRDNRFGIRQFPQLVNVNPPVISCNLMRYPRLGNTAFNRPGNQILVPFLPFQTMRPLHDNVAVFIIIVGADQRNRPHAAFFGKMPAAAAVGSVNSFSALNNRTDFLA